MSGRPSYAEQFPRRLQLLVERLAAERMATAQELAKAGGISPQSLSGWLKGRQCPKPAQVKRFCQKLKVDPQELLGPAAPTVGAARDGVGDTPAGYEVLGAFSETARRAEALKVRATVIGTVGSHAFGGIEGDTMEQVLSRAAVERQQYALEVIGKGFENIWPGNRVVFETGVAPRPNDLVVVRVAAEPRWRLARYILQGGLRSIVLIGSEQVQPLLDDPPVWYKVVRIETD